MASSAPRLLLMKAVYSDQELQQKLTVMAIDPAWQSPPELSRAIATDTRKWVDFIKAAHITAE